ncbi:hypothetical protein PsorP6_001853 [Peronosclerospora sorghi]|uniref:Uncharacterized protein n=1 Tax=Peronosclerospora sorghi TaxID=230839 RepID=A0ACC0WW41_9STRA|nr:hypothetical protein PsorP6_001853 [Peronosclerospora sorghi]
MPQPILPTPCPPQEDTPLQLNLVPRLEQKKSQRETPAMMKAPPLAPVVVEPLRCSIASSSLSFLSHINHIEIQDTVERDGVTYYVLEVYLFHYNSRLPTTVNNPRMAAAHDSETQAPDFRVERRYSDFSSLRHQVKVWTCRSAQSMCHYCHEFAHYMRFKLRQPGLLTSLTTNVEKRKSILQAFMIEFVALAQNPSKGSLHRCEAREHVPALLESFLRDS